MRDYFLMMTRRGWLGLALAGGGLALAAGATHAAFSRDMAHARARIGAGSLMIDTRHGAMEYATAGDGPPVLMIHGSGGGFDQGLAFAQRLADGGRTVIAPSRFGYLRSAFPDDPSSENQADAFVDLLDHLGVERIPVIGGSAGALSALAFAIRHPQRCSALCTLVPAAYAPNRSQPPVSEMQWAMMETALCSDFLFWLGATLAPDATIGSILATDPALVKRAAPDEQARVRRVLQDVLPVSARSRGLLNDSRLAGAPARMAYEQIQAPTLAISVEDDRYGTYEAARFIADTVPGAAFIGYLTGGHLWVGHDAEVFAAIAAFLSAHGV